MQMKLEKGPGGRRLGCKLFRCNLSTFTIPANPFGDSCTCFHITSTDLGDLAAAGLLAGLKQLQKRMRTNRVASQETTPTSQETSLPEETSPEP